MLWCCTSANVSYFPHHAFLLHKTPLQRHSWNHVRRREHSLLLGSPCLPLDTASRRAG